MDTDDRAALLAPGILIRGRWLDHGTGGELDHVNPSTGRIQQRFPIVGAEEIDGARRCRPGRVG